MRIQKDGILFLSIHIGTSPYRFSTQVIVIKSSILLFIRGSLTISNVCLVTKGLRDVNSSSYKFLKFIIFIYLLNFKILQFDKYKYKMLAITCICTHKYIYKETMIYIPCDNTTLFFINVFIIIIIIMVISITHSLVLI